MFHHCCCLCSRASQKNVVVNVVVSFGLYGPGFRVVVSDSGHFIAIVGEAMTLCDDCLGTGGGRWITFDSLSGRKGEMGIG